MTDHEHDVERATKLTKELLDRMIPEMNGNGCSDIRIDQIAIVGIVAFEDPDGDQAEAPFTAFETQKPHIKRGIIEMTLDWMREKP